MQYGGSQDGDAAPDFALPDVEYRSVALSDIVRRGQIIMVKCNIIGKS